MLQLTKIFWEINMFEFRATGHMGRAIVMYRNWNFMLAVSLTFAIVILLS